MHLFLSNIIAGPAACLLFFLSLPTDTCFNRRYNLVYDRKGESKRKREREKRGVLIFAINNISFCDSTPVEITVMHLLSGITWFLLD